MKRESFLLLRCRKHLKKISTRDNSGKDPVQKKKPVTARKTTMTKTEEGDFLNLSLRIGKNGSPEEDHNHKSICENDQKN